MTLFLNDDFAFLVLQVWVKSVSTLYLAVNNSLQRGYCLGDVLGIIKTAKVMIENERPEHVLLSLHDDDPLNFLWERFVRENLVTFIHDRWDKTSKHQQYEIFGQRRANRTVKGIPFDIYKELYPRLDGGDRQHIHEFGKNRQ